MRKLWRGLMAALLLALLALPVLASPEVQEGSGVHFGSYTLQPGNRVVGDLVVGVERNVKVDAAENPFALKINISD